MPEDERSVIARVAGRIYDLMDAPLVLPLLLSVELMFVALLNIVRASVTLKGLTIALSLPAGPGTMSWVRPGLGWTTALMAYVFLVIAVDVLLCIVRAAMDLRSPRPQSRSGRVYTMLSVHIFYFLMWGFRGYLTLGVIVWNFLAALVAAALIVLTVTRRTASVRRPA